jgi:hypothetical protein
VKEERRRTATDSLNSGKSSAVNSAGRRAGSALLEVGLREKEDASAPILVTPGEAGKRDAYLRVNALESLRIGDGAGGVRSGAETTTTVGKGATSTGGAGRSGASGDADVVGAGETRSAELRQETGQLQQASPSAGSKGKGRTNSGSEEQSAPRAPWFSQLPVWVLQ